MKAAPVVVGLGRVVHDAHYEQVGTENRYQGSRGGGSVWNILVECAANGNRVHGIGVAGDDRQGEVAMSDNCELGIDQNVEILPGRTTMTMHHIPSIKSDHRLRYITTSLCERCKKRPKASAALNMSSRISGGPASFDLVPGVFVADQFNNQTTEWATQLKASGWTTVIDIGYTGYLQYRLAAELSSALAHYDLIIVQKPVAKMLANKLGGEGVSIVRALGNILMVSDGENGLSAHDGRGGRVTSFEVAAPACPIVDTVGAGDLLLGKIISCMLDSGHKAGPLKADTRDVNEWAQKAMESVPEILAHVGARGNRSGSLVDVSQNAKPGECPICGSRPSSEGILPRPKRTARARSKSLSNLERRQLKLESIAQVGPAVNQCRSLLSSPKNTVVIGSGGSYIAAEGIARLLNYSWHEDSRLQASSSAIASAMRPMDVVRSPFGYERVIGVSYSGHSPDVVECVETVAAQGADAWMVTGGSIPLRLSDALPELESVAFGSSPAGSRRSTESGFVSIASAVAPVVLMSCAIADMDQVRDTIRSRMTIDTARNAALVASEFCGGGRGGLMALGSGWAVPALLDMESKFVEGGIAPMSISDLKDFSHGRFISLDPRRGVFSGVVLLLYGQESPYERLLQSVLRRELGEARVAVIRTERSGPLAMLDLLLASQTFSVHVADNNGIDISSPERPSKSWLSLYRWSKALA